MTAAMIFTIGHSRHVMEHFLALLQAHGIEELVDVRSHPRSRWAAQFGQASLERSLVEAGIRYTYLGGALGGRPMDRACYRADGSVDFERRATAFDFVDGVMELERRARSHQTAIVCAEEDPSQCHRRLLVAPALAALGFAIAHIRGDARVDSDADVERPTSRSNRQSNLFGDP